MERYSWRRRSTFGLIADLWLLPKRKSKLSCELKLLKTFDRVDNPQLLATRHPLANDWDKGRTAFRFNKPSVQPSMTLAITPLPVFPRARRKKGAGEIVWHSLRKLQMNPWLPSQSPSLHLASSSKSYKPVVRADVFLWFGDLVLRATYQDYLGRDGCIVGMKLAFVLASQKETVDALGMNSVRCYCMSPEMLKEGLKLRFYFILLFQAKENREHESW